MPIAETNAFVIGSKPFQEQDKLVYLLTENQGIKQGIAPGANKHKNRFGSLFELFTEGYFLYNWKELKNLITISKGEIISSHFDLVSDPGNIFHFYIMAEILQRGIPENQVNSRIYRLIKSILTARKAEIGMDVLLLYFLVWFLKIEGLMFKPDICNNCFKKGLAIAFLRDDYRGILCSDCHSSETIRVEREELNLLRWVFVNPPERPMPGTDQIDLKKNISLYIRKIEIHNDLTLKTKQYLQID